MWPPGERPKGRMLTLRSGGWVLILAALGVCIILLQALRTRVGRIGDGRNVETYRFDLTTCLVPRDRIIASGMPRDGVPALDAPEANEMSVLEEMKPRDRKKVALPSDTVIGVELGGEARAYPLRLLKVHEVVNDTLGGRDIAVTYHPLGDSTAVFDRRVGESTLTFGLSGLLWNSIPLLYDRTAEVGEESLWSQLMARAVSGSAAAAGRTLRRLPFRIETLEAWVSAHPETTVLAPHRRYTPLYKRNMYGNYFVTKVHRFPVEPFPPPGGVDPWSRVVLVGEGPIRPAEGEAGPILARACWWAWHASNPEDAAPLSSD